MTRPPMSLELMIRFLRFMQAALTGEPETANENAIGKNAGTLLQMELPLVLAFIRCGTASLRKAGLKLKEIGFVTNDGTVLPGELHEGHLTGGAYLLAHASDIVACLMDADGAGAAISIGLQLEALDVEADEDAE